MADTRVVFLPPSAPTAMTALDPRFNVGYAVQQLQMPSVAGVSSYHANTMPTTTQNPAMFSIRRIPLYETSGQTVPATTSSTPPEPIPRSNTGPRSGRIIPSMANSFVRRQGRHNELAHMRPYDRGTDNDRFNRTPFSILHVIDYSSRDTDRFIVPTSTMMLRLTPKGPAIYEFFTRPIPLKNERNRVIANAIVRLLIAADAGEDPQDQTDIPSALDGVRNRLLESYAGHIPAECKIDPTTTGFHFSLYHILM